MVAAPPSGAGYSGTPVVQKLGIKPGALVHLSGAPAGVDLGELPAGARITRRRPAKAAIDVAVIFTTEQRSLVDRFLEISVRAKKDAGIWVAWPKKASAVPTDVTEDVLRGLLLPTGFVDNKVCAIDERWSGLRFVLRREHR